MPITTILVSAYSSSPIVEGFVDDAGGILPGHLVAITATGGYSRDILAPSLQPVYVAVEDINKGAGVEDAYADGERVCLRRVQGGDICYVRLSNGQVAVLGSPIVPNGNILPGEHKVLVATTYALGIALEALTPSGSAELIKIEVKV